MEDKLKARIKWRCRRGMLELDVILERFIKIRLNTMEETELMHFESMLNESDPDLYAWLMGYENPPERYQELIKVIRDENYN